MVDVSGKITVQKFDVPCEESPLSSLRGAQMNKILSTFPRGYNL